MSTFARRRMGRKSDERRFHPQSVGDGQTALKEKLVWLPADTAEAEAELSRAAGDIVGIPHFQAIEPRAYEPLVRTCAGGPESAIAGCSGIAGSTVIGKNCTIAGAVGISGHIEIADNSHFQGGTIVTRGNTEAGQFASAPPMMKVKEWRKNSARYRQLDEWIRRIKALEQEQKNK